jgi:hypothetical protein
MKPGTRRGRILAVEEILENAMPPGFSEYLRFKEALRRWADVVGEALAARSTPDLAKGELLVVAETPLAAKRLSMMGGNIAKTLRERFDVDVARVRVVVGRAPLPKSQGGGTPSGRNKQGGGRSAGAGNREEENKALARRCLESSPDLPESAAESFAALRLFFDRRFPPKAR